MSGLPLKADVGGVSGFDVQCEKRTKRPHRTEVRIIVRGARLFRGDRVAGGRYRMATDGCALYLQMICPSGTNPPASGYVHADDGSKIRCA